MTLCCLRITAVGKFADTNETASCAGSRDYRSGWQVQRLAPHRDMPGWLEATQSLDVLCSVRIAARKIYTFSQPSALAVPSL
jgi:hypothetical protein